MKRFNHHRCGGSVVTGSRGDGRRNTPPARATSGPIFGLSGTTCGLDARLVERRRADRADGSHDNAGIQRLHDGVGQPEVPRDASQVLPLHLAREDDGVDVARRDRANQSVQRFDVVRQPPFVHAQLVQNARLATAARRRAARSAHRSGRGSLLHAVRSSGLIASSSSWLVYGIGRRHVGVTPNRLSAAVGFGPRHTTIPRFRDSSRTAAVPAARLPRTERCRADTGQKDKDASGRCSSRVRSSRTMSAQSIGVSLTAGAERTLPP